MRNLTIFCAIIACLFLSGCIQNDTVIHVKPDGSGTIEETVALSNMLMASFQNMSKGMSEGDAGAKPDADAGSAASADGKDNHKDTDGAKDKAEGMDSFIQSMMKDAQARETQYGPGVKFVSAAPVKTETMSGYKAIYAFKNINTLRINQNPEKKTGMPADSKDQAAKKEEIISFNFVKGPVSKLTVHMPAMDKKNDTGKGDEQKPKPAPDPGTAEMTKMFFKDMSISLVLVIDGSIVETNATYRDKSQLTLLDMNFGKIIENAKVFEKLNAEQPKTIEEMKGLVKEIAGLKIEMNNPVEVAFK
ncbi:MAG TPA: hypothetical protein VMB78_05445 [Dissulfurispiraceae bacterium]|nr:hypothetical protein [Dissulfurispiraceae bacterium]